MSKAMPIRLAIRTEGEMLNAYLARGDSMDGALLMGTLMRSIAERDTDIWQRWKAMMTDALRNAVEDAFGQTPEFTEQRAPEHERASRA